MISGKPDEFGAQEPALGRDFGSHVRELRQRRHWSLESLSKASGVSRSMLSEIERNQANPTLATALGIARAFGLRLGDMVDGHPGDSRLQVIRSNDPSYDYRSDAECALRTLSPLAPDRIFEFYRVDFEPGGALRSSPHFDGTRELVYVDRGRVIVESGEESSRLGVGDSIMYAADVPHAIVNAGRSHARVFLIDLFPPNG
jgi:transcriptional regulator with XRE-family HTH domain